MGEKRNAYRILVGDDSIKMDLREIGWGSMD
jgi:hypothetical protein